MAIPDSGPRQVNPPRFARGWRIALAVVAVVGVAGLLAGAWHLWVRGSGEPAVLRVVAGPRGSDSFVMMDEIAEVVARHTGAIRLTVISSRDSSDNMGLLNKGGAELATVRDSTPAVASIRLVSGLFTDYFQLIARRDSGIGSVEALTGARIAVPDFGTDAYLAFWSVADHYDLDPESLDWQAMSFTEARDALLAGEIDVLFTVSSLRDAALLRLVELADQDRVRLHYIPISQAGAIRIKRPLLKTGTIVAGALDGRIRLPDRDVPTVIVNRQLVARSDVPAAAIAALTSVLFEYRLDLILRTPLGAEITQPDRRDGVGVPLHEGAGWYFDRDKPGFLEQNAELMSFFVAIGVVLWSAFAALRGRLEAGRKNRADSYNHRLLTLADQVRTVSAIGALEPVKDAHQKVLEDMVVALDTDQVTAEGFQSFALLWESVAQMIADKRAGLGA